MSQRLGEVTQDPDEALYYGIDVSDQVEGDTVATATWAAPSPTGLTQTGSGAHTATILTTPKWSSGTVGADYVCEVTFTTTTRQETLQGHVLVRVRS